MGERAEGLGRNRPPEFTPYIDLTASLYIAPSQRIKMASKLSA